MCLSNQAAIRPKGSDDVHYIFNELKLHRIIANYLPRNKRSGALLKRLGFEIEGKARELLKINGV
ncbi:MAG: GNAT family N-acetyltransferase [Pseudomonadales bacterium]|jgi:ribosomal-protein-alanine N-acetyltransferase|nr:GNAT family N-acetyltransferase [Pseudomonadales bacterium]|tara:strand:- start:507 stop:701 length:195 start_codon:yes stop_codon:yes gene_type:complete